MLSSLMITHKKVVLIIDDLDRERIAHKFIDRMLKEQGENETTRRIIEPSERLRSTDYFGELLSPQIIGNDEKPAAFNVLLPTMADLLIYLRTEQIFQLIYKLSRSPNVKRLFLWISTLHLSHVNVEYLIGACQAMADLVFHFRTATELTMFSRKSIGSLMKKDYTCSITRTQFSVVPAKKPKPVHSATTTTDDTEFEPYASFKIEMNEKEKAARHALRMPYEPIKVEQDGKIIYVPEAQDDFDEEDPDDDLLI